MGICSSTQAVSGAAVPGPAPAARGGDAGAAGAASTRELTSASSMRTSLLAPQTRTFAESYDLREELGKGQYATVYRVVSKPGVGDKFGGAAKVIIKSRLTPEDLAALNVEVRAMDLLKDHPNFVKCHDFFSEKDYFYLTMELLTGGELFDRIVEKDKYTEREARQVMYLMANAIAYAHSHGIVHRDLKPENILLKSKGDDTSIKIADLGFATIMTNPSQLMKTPCGTPGYVAPEVLANKPYGSQCDVWSLGVIFYILLCGYPPFSDDDQNKLFAQIQSGRYAMDPAEWSVISPSAKDLVKKILVVDPAKRLTAQGILAHPWMKMKLEEIPDLSLVESLKKLKKFQARRRLKKALQGVRSIVRMRMLLGAKRAVELKKAGASEDEITNAFFAGAQTAPPKRGAAGGSPVITTANPIGAAR